MKEISLTKGKSAVVDDADFEFLSRWRWHFSEGYALRRGAGNKLLRMHRVIIGAVAGQQVDHIDCNRLNNQRHNLRLATYAGNATNRIKRAGRSSSFKGVCWFKRVQKWVAYVDHEKRRLHLGYFEAEVDAAAAYNAAARSLHGEFARLNET